MYKPAGAQKNRYGFLAANNNGAKDDQSRSQRRNISATKKGDFRRKNASIDDARPVNTWQSLEQYQFNANSSVGRHPGTNSRNNAHNMSVDEMRNASVEEKRYNSLERQLRAQSRGSDFAIGAYDSTEKIKVLNG